jgi:Putative restriction endonuclease
MRANVTRAAEGFDHRSFMVAEILRMQDAGIISDDENFELIEGEIVPMQPKTHVHEPLTIGISQALPERLWRGIETTIYVSRNTFVEPDFVVHPKGIKLEEVKGSDILLAIEVALTSLDCDRGLKGEALRAPRNQRVLGDRCGAAANFHPFRPRSRRLAFDRRKRLRSRADLRRASGLFGPAGVGLSRASRTA